MQIEAKTVRPEQLLLDPNNYRFHDLNGYRPVSRARYAEQGVQDRALQFLRDTASFDLNALRDSIISNGFVPFEQIVVETYDGEGDNARYVVVEGNRRTAAIKTILADCNGGGLDLSKDVVDTLQQFTVIEIVGTDAERANYQKTLMAIRHVAGIREWGPYQQARLVVEMYDKEEGAFGPVAQRIGINAREVARRYRASKALEQMEKDDEYGDRADPKLYAFFHEAVSQPKVREWLKFSDETYAAEDAEARKLFYELLTPREIDGAKLPPKLQSANPQVRQLKDIVDKPVPLKVLADPERTFHDALKSAEAETSSDETGLLEHAIGVALNSLKQPSIDAWLSPDEDAKALWTEFVALVDKVRAFMQQQA
ncbi:hypothetical protein [Erythrobacter colymbi]|uniref:hypothetical protein n=1 Tax=Erythrobacter colymbi TaxID=1161202 RepID=UPI00117D0E8A|nr:hypothetical protein [Erythrobacter colymbi]